MDDSFRSSSLSSDSFLVEPVWLGGSLNHLMRFARQSFCFFVLALVGRGIWSYPIPGIHGRTASLFVAANGDDSSSSQTQNSLQTDDKIIKATSNPYEAIAFPSYRLDLTSSLDDNASSPWWMIRRRRNDRHYCDDQSSTKIMARLWRITANGIPMNVAFPKANDAVTIQQFVPLLDFLNEHQRDDSKLHASYERVDGIPCVRFSARSNVTITNTEQCDVDPAIIEPRIQAWVKRVLVNLQICPFTKSVTYSGQGVPNVPVAKIDYGTTRAMSIASLLADAFDRIDHMLVKGPKEISSILLAAPYFDDRFSLWAGVMFCLLEHSVIAAKATSDIGVVCFHPEYQTPDGSSFPGFGHMHSVGRLQQWAGTDRATAAAGGAWQRRTPHAVINVLRAEQLAAAESLRSTPELYCDNIRKLMAIAEELPIALAQERAME